jgi:signal recognition particle subunit SRP54
LAGRILGMGDMLTLIEKAEQVYEKEEAEAAAAKLLEGKFTLDDFLSQMQQVKKMGSLKDTLKLLPGVPKEVRDVDIDGKEIDHIEAIIRSMTLDERVRPELIDGSRRTRIANGSGTTPAQVDQLIKQFKEMSKMMNRMGGFGTKRMTKKNRKNAKKANKRGGGGGRVTQGRPPLRLPDLTEGLGAAAGPGGLPDLSDLPDLSELGGPGTRV